MTTRENYELLDATFKVPDCSYCHNTGRVDTIAGTTSCSKCRREREQEQARCAYAKNYTDGWRACDELNKTKLKQWQERAVDLEYLSMNRLHEIEALTLENKTLREALEEVDRQLEVGFVRCETCGDQEDTDTFDCRYDIKQALATTTATEQLKDKP